ESLVGFALCAGPGGGPPGWGGGRAVAPAGQPPARPLSRATRGRSVTRIGSLDLVPPRFDGAGELLEGFLALLAAVLDLVRKTGPLRFVERRGHQALE